MTDSVNFDETKYNNIKKKYQDLEAAIEGIKAKLTKVQDYSIKKYSYDHINVIDKGTGYSLTNYGNFVQTKLTQFFEDIEPLITQLDKEKNIMLDSETKFDNIKRSYDALAAEPFFGNVLVYNEKQTLKDGYIYDGGHTISKTNNDGSVELYDINENCIQSGEVIITAKYTELKDPTSQQQYKIKYNYSNGCVSILKNDEYVSIKPSDPCCKLIDKNFDSPDQEQEYKYNAAKAVSIIEKYDEITFKNKFNEKMYTFNTKDNTVTYNIDKIINQKIEFKTDKDATSVFENIQGEKFTDNNWNAFKQYINNNKNKLYISGDFEVFTNPNANGGEVISNADGPLECKILGINEISGQMAVKILGQEETYYIPKDALIKHNLMSTSENNKVQIGTYDLRSVSK